MQITDFIPIPERAQDMRDPRGSRVALASQL